MKKNDGEKTEGRGSENSLGPTIYGGLVESVFIKRWVPLET